MTSGMAIITLTPSTHSTWYVRDYGVITCKYLTEVTKSYLPKVTPLPSGASSTFLHNCWHGNVAFPWEILTYHQQGDILVHRLITTDLTAPQKCREKWRKEVQLNIAMAARPSAGARRSQFGIQNTPEPHLYQEIMQMGQNHLQSRERHLQNLSKQCLPFLPF